MNKAFESAFVTICNFYGSYYNSSRVQIEGRGGGWPLGGLEGTVHLFKDWKSMTKKNEVCREKK